MASIASDTTAGPPVNKTSPESENRMVPDSNAKDDALRALEERKAQLAEIEIFAQHVAKDDAFDEEDTEKIGEAVSQSREEVRRAEEVSARYEKFYEKLILMRAQLAARLDLLRNFEARVDLSGMHRELGKYFREKQIRLAEMATKLESFLKYGPDVP